MSPIVKLRPVLASTLPEGVDRSHPKKSQTNHHKGETPLESTGEEEGNRIDADPSWRRDVRTVYKQRQTRTYRYGYMCAHVHWGDVEALAQDGSAWWTLVDGLPRRSMTSHRVSDIDRPLGSLA